MPLLALLLLACAGNDDTGDTDTAVEDTTPDPDPCQSVEIEAMGPEEPRIGDEWTVWLRCDGSTLYGTTVLRFEPTTFAEIDGNVATFREAGTAEMMMQVGAYREYMDVTVRD